jgi:hypothetical protein
MTAIFNKFIKIVMLFIYNHWNWWQNIFIGAIGSLIASVVYYWILINRRPKIEIFPAIIENESDAMCYIILWVRDSWKYRKKAIDIKLHAHLHGTGSWFFGNPEAMYELPIPLYKAEWPILESRWQHNNKQRYLVMPIMLTRKLWEDIKNQIDFIKCDNEIRIIGSRIDNYLKGNETISEKEFREIFLKLFSRVYTEIQVSVNYQDEFSGVRKTVTRRLYQVQKYDVSKDINWMTKAKELKVRRQ